MSNEQKKNEVPSAIANVQAAKSAPRDSEPDADPKDAEIAALKAQLAAAGAPQPRAAAPEVPLSLKNANDPVLVEMKHGCYTGIVDGDVIEKGEIVSQKYTRENPAKVGARFRMPRVLAYRAAERGVLTVL